MAAVPLTLETSPQTTANIESNLVITPLPQLKTEAIHYAERPSNLTLVEPQHSHNTPSSALSPASVLTFGGGRSISPALSSTGSLSPSFLPEMPQWKRDLIQRRKQNVQRTLSASSQSPSQSPSPSPSVATAAATAAVTLSATSLNISGAGGVLYGGLKKSTSLSSSVRSLAGSNTNIDQLAAADGLLQPQQQHNLTKDYTTLKVVNKQQQQQYATTTTPNAIATNTTKPATINYIKSSSSSSSSSTTTPLLTSPLCSSSSSLKEKAERLFGGQYTATTKEEIFIQTQQQQKQNFKKENHTEEMAENIIKSKEQEQEFVQAAASAVEEEIEEAETYEMLKKTKEIQEEQLNEEQINETATITIKTSDITNKQQLQLQQTATRLTGSTCTTTHTSLSTLTSTSSSSSSLLVTKRATAINNEYEREHLASHFSGSGGGGSGINSHSHSITGANVNIVNQLLTKCESERLVCAANTTIATTTTVNNTNIQNNSTTGYSNNYFNNLNNSSVSVTIGGNTGVNNGNNNNSSSSSSSSCSGGSNNSGGLNSVSVANVVKISQKLQENQFIKNEQQQLQQQQQQQQKKFPRYQKFNNTTATVVGGGGVGVLDLKSPTRTFLTTSSSSTSLSLTSPTSSVTAAAAAAAALGGGFNSNCAIKKKMVAVQEMKKSTQNSATHLHPISTTCNNSQQQQQQQQQLNRALATNRGVIVGGGGVGGINNPATDLDTSEDLSYGPGIVSKLRCRYLSLALRESMEQQRLNKDHLRRSTSLNNLLDNTTEDDDDDEEEEEEDLIDGEVVAGDTEQNNESKDLPNHHHLQMNKKTSGILKSSLNNGQEKRFSSTTHNSQGSNGVGVTFTETTFTKRSRHLKRGNDSLKRARSVEALLSEKSPWQVRANSSTNCGVSIEDKIQNARERLHQGTDQMPPKRLTSIIDDTERPPPDLVKQTLKKFEATANRRPRLNSRSNSKGDVASKVETFKNIEKKQKPVVNYPKPISPTKKLQKPLKTSSPQANDLLQSPLGRKVMATANAISNNVSAANDTATTTSLKSGGSGNTLSEHTPDIIPRQTQTQQTKFTTNERDFKQNKELFASKEKALVVDILKRGGENNKEKTDVVSTPVAALTKEFSKFKISSKSDNFCSLGSSSSSSVSSSSLTDNRESESVKDGGGGGGGGGSSSVDLNIGDACQRHNKYPYNNSNNDETTNQQQQQQLQELNINALKNENDKIINNKTKQINNETSPLSSSSSSIAANATIEMKNEATTVKNYENLLVKTATASPPASSSDLSDGGNEYDVEDVEYGGNTETNATTKRITRTALDNIAKAGFTQQFKFNNSQQQQQSTTISSSSSTSSPLNAGKQIGVIRPLLNTQTTTTTTKTSLDNNMETLNHTHTSTSTTSPLTSREIEKNRINDMKKSTSSSSSSSSSTSLDNVIKSSPATVSAGSTANTTSGVGSSTGFSDVDTVISATNSPLWAMRKRRQTPPAAPAENTTMVFNFSNRKEVPDYIDNDGVIFRRKRELPKPNESGFVLLGDLSVETSTDMDYDDFSMCPPSPCDVEFINANIVIDGKSSIRQKSKETTHYRVQFNDTLNSTFEYPSAASLCMDDSFSAYNENYTQPHGSNPLMANDLSQAFQNLCLENTQHQQQQQQQQQHHHVADEIIQLPTLNASLPAVANNTSSPLNTSSMGGGSNTTPTKNILGNLPLGSAPLGFYTPLKAPIDRLFQLGVTRAPSLLSNESTATTTPTDASTNANAPATTNGGSRLFNGYGICDDDTGNGSIVGITDGLIKDHHLNDDTNNKLKNKTIMNADYNEDCEEPESLQYIKPADDDLNIAYSEGTQKTDLLY